MRYFSADLIVPVTSPPLKQGTIAVHSDGRISGMFRKGEAPVSASETEYLHGVLCPGFVNTHCHLELSYLKGRIAQGTQLDGFISQLQIEKSKTIQPEEIQMAIFQAEQEMLSEGIVAAGDISNTADSFVVKENRNLKYHTFIEVFGSEPTWAEKIFGKAHLLYKQALAKGLPASIVPHSPYSVSTKLFKLIYAFADETAGIMSIHHQESEDENRYFETGEGPVAERLRRFGIINGNAPVSAKRPIQAISSYLPGINPVILVHNSVSTSEDIAFAMSRFSKLWWCLCPNSNLYITGNLPDVPALRRAGAKITLGTDSLASNSRLSILAEMKTLSAMFPETGIEELILWSTLNGAEALGLEDTLGSFDRGKRPGVVLIEQEADNDVVLLPGSKVRRII
jgi:aminodeoxyfutalosine deaminase